jgi:hypothetical protein
MVRKSIQQVLKAVKVTKLAVAPAKATKALKACYLGFRVKEVQQVMKSVKFLDITKKALRKFKGKYSGMILL